MQGYNYNNKTRNLSKIMDIGLTETKIIHLTEQLLWDNPAALSDCDIAKKIGYIQIDSISSIARSHNLVCHTRSTTYKEDELWSNLEKGKLFEWFAHARCLLPIEDFKFYYAKMVNLREMKANWQTVIDNNPKLITQIITQVEDQGPISIKDINVPKDFPKGSGWNSPKKRIMDYLFSRGYLLTCKRKKFKTYYDLPENVVGKLPDKLPDSLEIFWFQILNSLKANGPTMLHRLLHYNYNQKSFLFEGKKYNPRELIINSVKNGKLVEINIQDQKDPIYALPDQVTNIDNIEWKEEDQLSVHFLSPFDNSLWSREALARQYLFDYKMEIYVPKNKRVYGYFVMPILWGTDFVGRVDVKIERKSGILNLIKWSWEDGFTPSKYFWEAIADTINRFILFHNAEKITLGNLSNVYKQGFVTVKPIL